MISVSIEQQIFLKQLLVNYVMQMDEKLFPCIILKHMDIILMGLFKLFSYFAHYK